MYPSDCRLTLHHSALLLTYFFFKPLSFRVICYATVDTNTGASIPGCSCFTPPVSTLKKKKRLHYENEFSPQTLSALHEKMILPLRVLPFF